MENKKAFLKKDKLIRHLQSLDSLLVAFSGGVDSSFLLAVSHQVLRDKVVAATADSSIYTRREFEEAREFTKQREISHIILKFDATQMRDVMENGPDRCYFCKKALFKKLLRIAEEKELKFVAHAANMDDMKDFRPGQRAADEMGIIAPLVHAGLNKEEIRFLSKDMGLPIWDKPSMACLASRIPYGEPITNDVLKMIDEGETFLSKQGFRQYRVRFHGYVARIEVEQFEIKKICEDKTRALIVKKFRDIGFHHIAVDLEGFVSGSMNRALNLEE